MSEPQHPTSDPPPAADPAPGTAPTAPPSEVARPQIIYRFQNPEPNAGRSFIVTMLMMMFMFSGGSGPPVSAGGPLGLTPREQFRNKIERQRHALDVLNETQWGDFKPTHNTSELGMGSRWINVTGFRKEDGFAWEKLDGARSRVAEFEKEVGLGFGADGESVNGFAIYENVTGIVKGRWVKSKGLGEEFGGGKERLNLTGTTPNTIWAWDSWDRNITGKEGKLMLSVQEKDENTEASKMDVDDKSESIREVSATLTVQDETSMGDGWAMRLHGVHWPRRGSLVMTTTSEKFAGIFELPHLTASNEDFKSSQKLLNRTLTGVLDKKERSIFNIDLRDPWSADEIITVPHCEYVVYVQVHPILPQDMQRAVLRPAKEVTSSEIQDIESELRFPSGAPTPSAPALQMSVVIFSPDCGFVLESKGPPSYTPAEWRHLMGYKEEVFMQRLKHWCLIWSVALFAQAYLIRMQTKDASTPSTVSRISLYTIGVMTVADFLPCVGLMVLANSVPGLQPSATFAAFTIFLGIGLTFRFFMEINAVQGPARRERARAQAAVLAAQRAASQPSQPSATFPIITPGSVDTLPLPVTASRPVQTNEAPVIIPSDQDIDAEIANVTAAAAPVAVPLITQPRPTVVPPPPANSDMPARFGQSILGVFIFMLFTANATTWSPPYRTAYINLISGIYLSLWIPQIYRNIIRNCRKALLWKFVIGQSVLRLLPFAYFYLKEDNVLFSETSSITFIVLLGWIWIQIWALVIQEVLGPRIGIPKGWLPEAWDYHPVLREDDVEGGGMPIGLVKVPGSPTLERVRTGEEVRKKSDNHIRTVDCAICMNVLEVPVIPAVGGDGAGGVAGMLARRLYMVTPCRHVFHTVCLEGWMRFRLQCPICRETLPAL